MLNTSRQPLTRLLHFRMGGDAVYAGPLLPKRTFRNGVLRHALGSYQMSRVLALDEVRCTIPTICVIQEGSYGANHVGSTLLRDVKSWPRGVSVQDWLGSLHLLVMRPSGEWGLAYRHRGLRHGLTSASVLRLGIAHGWGGIMTVPPYGALGTCVLRIMFDGSPNVLCCTNGWPCYCL